MRWAGLIPVRLASFKLDAPEPGSWRKKLDTDPLSGILQFTDENNAAFQLLLRQKILQDNHHAILDFVAHVQQPAVGIYHHCLANLAKLSPVVAPPLGLYAHFVKNTLAPSCAGLEYFAHRSILSAASKTVNCP